MPKGCGLASSASGLCALTLAALGAWMQASDFERLSQLGYSKQQLAYWARLGSGSAGRSMWGGFVSWDKTLSPETQTITPLWEAEHWDLWDMVLLMSHQEKPVSSTEAHAYAHTSPLFPIRLAHITHREADIKDALAQKHFDRLGAYIEQESLDMHAVIMTAKPPVYYWSPLVPEVLSWIRKERTQGRLPAYFTMDAGPNIHVLCQGSDKDYVAAALKKAWPHWELLIDSVGTGPTLTCLSR
jgi:diphosphomevalonate decarboxylase